MDEIIGKKIEKLTILEKAEKTTRHRYKYLCKCACGNTKKLLLSNILSGKSKSCGKCNDNHYEIAEGGRTVIGYFPDGMAFYFDHSDFEKVKLFSWYLCGYPNKIIIANRYRDTLHRYLMGFPDCEVDHIDLNRFNNRRRNLRLCSHRENQCNHKLQANNTSGAAGVRFHKSKNKYAARIKHYGKEIHLGYYFEIVGAMQARNVAMQLLFGEFSRMNDVPPAPAWIEAYVKQRCLPYIEAEVCANG